MNFDITGGTRNASLFLEFLSLECNEVHLWSISSTFHTQFFLWESALQSFFLLTCNQRKAAEKNFVPKNGWLKHWKLTCTSVNHSIFLLRHFNKGWRTQWLQMHPSDVGCRKRSCRGSQLRSNSISLTCLRASFTNKSYQLRLDLYFTNYCCTYIAWPMYEALTTHFFCHEK